jgi:hypothetical protein
MPGANWRGDAPHVRYALGEALRKVDWSGKQVEANLKSHRILGEAYRTPH